MKIRMLFQITFAAGLPSSVAFSATRSATFDARPELKGTVPEGAKRIRIWFAMPQDDSLQQAKSTGRRFV